MRSVHFKMGIVCIDGVLRDEWVVNIEVFKQDCRAWKADLQLSLRIESGISAKHHEAAIS